MKTFYLTDAGKVRDHNEDSVICFRSVIQIEGRENDCSIQLVQPVTVHNACVIYPLQQLEKA